MRMKKNNRSKQEGKNKKNKAITSRAAVRFDNQYESHCVWIFLGGGGGICVSKMTVFIILVIRFWD